MHEFMDHDVVPHPLRHRHQPPVQAHVTVPPTGAPSRALITDAHPCDSEAVAGCELEQPDRELGLRPGPQLQPVGDRQSRRQQRGALAPHPLDVTLSKGIGFAPRAAARNGDADAAIGFDSQQVSPRAAVPHEVNRCDRFELGGRELGIDAATKWKPELHAEQDTRFTNRA